MRSNIYLFFGGDCRDAFAFYAAVTGGTIGTSATYGDAPGEAPGGAAMADKIMHVSLEIGGTTLMGSDMPGGQAKPPQGFAVALSAGSVDEAERLFAALAEGGTITMPMGETFWTERFGMLVDRFGVPWMVNMDGPPPA